MESRRKQNWSNYGRSRNGRPPRGNWQPTIPLWEKQFCSVVGSLDWDTLLQMKKFIHLYENVLRWDDSAGKEAFFNAKKRFWSKINSLPCDISLPDPDLYIDEIIWDSETDAYEFDEFKHVTSGADENHEPVIIFGDSLIPRDLCSGWGDEEDKSKPPLNTLPDNQWLGHLNNQSRGSSWDTGWGWSSAKDNRIIHEHLPSNGTVDPGTQIWNTYEHDFVPTKTGGGNISSQTPWRAQGNFGYANNKPRSFVTDRIPLTGKTILQPKKAVGIQ